MGFAAAIAWMGVGMTVAGYFAEDPVLMSVGSIMLGFAAGGPLGGAVAVATSPISPLDFSVKEAIGWAYMAYGLYQFAHDLYRSYCYAAAGARNGASSAASQQSLPPGECRPWTEGVKEMAPFFFSDVDPNTSLVCNRPYVPGQPEGLAISPDGNIYFNNSDYLDDFSKGSLADQGWFMHEVTHVWQVQHGINVAGKSAWAYAFRKTDYFPLTSSTTWEMLNVEQQANLVRDIYFRMHGALVPEIPTNFRIIIIIP